MRKRAVIAATSACALLCIAVVPAAFGAATPSIHTVTGKITSPYNGTPYPVPATCVYPFYVPADASAAAAANYLPTQLLANTGQCSDSKGNYSVSVPGDLLDNLTVKALVVAPKSLVSRIVDLPATTGTLDISLDVTSTSLVDSVPVTDLALHTPWGAIGLVTDHATGAVLGAGIVETSLVKNDPKKHMYAGLALSGETQINVHYLLPDAAVTTDVASQLDVTATAGVNTVIPEFLVGPLVTVSGKVNAHGSTVAKWQLVGANCPDGSCGTLGLTSANGTYKFVTTADVPHDFSLGGQILRDAFASGNAIFDAVTIVPPGGKTTTYGSAPQTWFAARTPVALSGKASWTWTGGALESAPAYWQTTVAMSTSTSGLGAYSAPAKTTVASLSQNLAKGATVCLRARTTTFYSPAGATNVGPYVLQCQSVPLDERSLVYSGKWAKSTNAKAYAKTLSTSRAAKSSVTLLHATGHQVAVVWARASNGGSFTVSVNGAKVATVNTKGATAFQKYTVVTTKSFKNAKVVVTATSAAPVAVDGLVAIP